MRFDWRYPASRTTPHALRVFTPQSTVADRCKARARAKRGSSGALKNKGRRAAPTGFTREGKTLVFLRGRDASSAESFSRSLQGRDACVARVVREGHPGM